MAVPSIIGALGTTPQGLRKNLNCYNLDQIRMAQLQTTALSIYNQLLSL